MPVFNSRFDSTQLSGLVEMANNASDILSAVQDVSEVVSTVGQYSSSISEMQSDIAAISDGLVEVKEFSISQGDFQLQSGGFYTASVTHNLRRRTPIVQVFDNGSDGNGRDLQLVQVVGSTDNAVSLKLTSVQYQDADYPLHVKVMDSIGAEGVDLMAGFTVPNLDGVLVRYNPSIQRVERKAVGGQNWERVRDDQDITHAILAQDGWIHVRVAGTGYFYVTDVAGGFWDGSNSGNWGALTSNPNSIILHEVIVI